MTTNYILDVVAPEAKLGDWYGRSTSWWWEDEGAESGARPPARMQGAEPPLGGHGDLLGAWRAKPRPQKLEYSCILRHGKSVFMNT